MDAVLGVQELGLIMMKVKDNDCVDGYDDVMVMVIMVECVSVCTM